MTHLKTEKQRLRKQFSNLRQQLSQKRKNQASEAIASFSQKLPSGSIVMSFLSFKSEINMTLANQILLTDFFLILPKIHENQLVPVLIPSIQKLSSLSHPKELSNQPLEIISSQLITHAFIPGLVFDVEKFRLGYGKGFYDRWLAQTPNIVSIGVGYLEQQIEKLPREAHDISLTQLFLS